MLKCFEIKRDSKLYADYFSYLKDAEKWRAAYDKVCEAFGIESNRFYPNKNSLYIAPTVNDREKFRDMMKKTNDGEFKKNSAPSKMWCKLVKDVEWFQKPALMFYFRIGDLRWKEQLFHIRDKLYCSIDLSTETGYVLSTDFAIEMKASEFYKIIENYQSVKGGEADV